MKPCGTHRNSLRNRRTWRIAAVILAGSFLLQPANTQNRSNYTSARYGWSIFYPSTWALDDSQSDFVRVTTLDHHGVCGIHSGVIRFRSADAFADFMLDSMAKSFHERKGLQSETLSRKKITLSSGQEAVDALVAIRIGGESRRIFTVSDGMGFAVDCETEERNWHNLERMFDGIMTSFSLSTSHGTR